MKHRNLKFYTCLGVMSLLAVGLMGEIAPVETVKRQIIKRDTEEKTYVNVASQASVSAHYTASWNNLAAVNDGAVNLNTTDNSLTWASWSNNGTRPSEGWLVYEWPSALSFSKSVIYFWTDIAGDNVGTNVAMPASYTIQYWDAVGATWKDVTLSGMESYPREREAANEVTFEPVETTKLRLFMNPSTDGTWYSALGVSEWEAYVEASKPVMTFNKANIVLSEQRSLQQVQIKLKGMSLAEDGVTVSLEGDLPGASIQEGCTSFTKADAEAGVDVGFAFDAAAVGAKTALGYAVFTSGTTVKKVPLMTSMDEGFVEHAVNLVYDPCGYTLDRLTLWKTVPQIVTLAEYENVKCGATCIKLEGAKSGIEIKNTTASSLYLPAGKYVFSGWVNTNGTFEAGVYTTEANVLSAEGEYWMSDDRMQLSFTIPNTNGEWSKFEFTFSISKNLVCGAWINNDHGKTGTLAYLDNYEIYNADYTGEKTEITVYKDYAITPVTFNQVHFTDAFWKPRMVQNQEVTIPEALRLCYENGRVDNFKKAAGLLEGYFVGDNTFDDTDIYKILEGMSYSIQVSPNEELSQEMDELIELLGQAQEDDGYLYTPRTAGDPAHPHKWMGANRWEKTPDLSHELYNCGHLYEAAYAHYNATGKRTLLEIALKNADLLVKDFLVGGLPYEPGHQIVEMGLVKLFRITGNKDYLALAKYFLDLRGTKGVMRQQYSQSHEPVVLQSEAVGHAVRAAYMYSGMADVAAMTDNQAYLDAIDRIWENVVSKKLYINGGIGALHAGEAFGANYELPNMTAYCETCAAIANVYWNHRLFLLHGNSKYYDVLERSLYNNVLSGIGFDGKSFFYPNPLESDGKYAFNQDGHVTRAPWFGCACCPSNLCRFMASVPGYVYAQKDNDIYVNLFVQCETELTLQDEKTVSLKQETNYPWEGNVKIAVSPSAAATFTMRFRIPGWAQNRPVPSDLYHYKEEASAVTQFLVNGEAVESQPDTDGYVSIKREWSEGDVVEINFPMDIHRVESNANVAANQGLVALERGPLVYCVESPDNSNLDLNRMAVEETSAVSVKDYTVNEVNLKAFDIAAAKEDIGTVGKVNVTAIPYYAWANRGASVMKVWMKTEAREKMAYEFKAANWVQVDRGTVEQDIESNTLKVTGAGTHNIAVNFSPAYDNLYALSSSQKYFLVKGKDLSLVPTESNLWWLNGWNHNSADMPTWTYKNNEGDCFIIWNVTKGAFTAEWLASDVFNFKTNGSLGTCFGLTSTAADGVSVLSDLSFYTPEKMIETYPELRNLGWNALELNEGNESYAAPIGADLYDVTLTRSLKTGDKWNTFCVPFDMNAAQLAENHITEVRVLHEIVSESGSSVTLSFKQADVVKAGQPCLVKAAAGYTGSIQVKGVAVKSEAPLTEVAGSHVNMTGNYVKTTVPEGSFFISDNTFYLADKESGVSLKGFRAYVDYMGSVEVNRMLIDIDGFVTSINGTLEDEILSKPVDVYTLSGLKVRSAVNRMDALSGLQHGVYIINGEKVIK